MFENKRWYESKVGKSLVTYAGIGIILLGLGPIVNSCINSFIELYKSDTELRIALDDNKRKLEVKMYEEDQETLRHKMTLDEDTRQYNIQLEKLKRMENLLEEAKELDEKTTPKLFNKFMPIPGSAQKQI